MTSTATTRATDRLVFDGTRQIIVGGLVIGAALGFSGNFFEPGPVQSILYALSAAGLILASLLLVGVHASAGRRLAATGFALLALGETRVLNPTDTPAGEDSFAVGVLLYAPALLLIALAGWGPLWVRLVGAAAAVPFAAHSLIYLGGGAVDSSGPLAGTGYALLTLAVVGWIATVLRSAGDASGGSSDARSA